MGGRPLPSLSGNPCSLLSSGTPPPGSLPVPPTTPTVNPNTVLLSLGSELLVHSRCSIRGARTCTRQVWGHAVSENQGDPPGHSQGRSPSRSQAEPWGKLGLHAGQRDRQERAGASLPGRMGPSPGADKPLRGERVLLADGAGSQLREATRCGKTTSPEGPHGSQPRARQRRLFCHCRVPGPTRGSGWRGSRATANGVALTKSRPLSEPQFPRRHTEDQREAFTHQPIFHLLRLRPEGAVGCLGSRSCWVAGRHGAAALSRGQEEPFWAPVHALLKPGARSGQQPNSKFTEHLLRAKPWMQKRTGRPP